MITKPSASAHFVKPKPFAGGAVPAVRAALIQRGTNLTSWCRDQGITRSTAVSALAGVATTPAAAKLRRSILDAVGLAEPQARDAR